MSSFIIYDRRFIRTTRGIIPMILGGASNCTEFTLDSMGRPRERLERNWCIMHDSFTELPEKEFMARLPDYSDRPDCQLFRFHGEWVCGKQAAAWYRNGIRQANTLEEYLLLNRHQGFLCHLTVYPDKKDFTVKQECIANCRTTAELEGWLDEARKRKAEIFREFPNAEIFFHMEFSSNEPIRAVPVKKGDVIAKLHNRYIKSFVKGQMFSLTDDPCEAACFSSPKEAYEALGYQMQDIRFLDAASARKPKEYILKATGGQLAGMYIGGLRTNRKLRGVLDKAQAKHFPSKNAAYAYAKAIRERYTTQQTGTLELINLAEKSTELLNI